VAIPLKEGKLSFCYNKIYILSYIGIPVALTTKVQIKVQKKKKNQHHKCKNYIIEKSGGNNPEKFYLPRARALMPVG